MILLNYSLCHQFLNIICASVVAGTISQTQNKQFQLKIEGKNKNKSNIMFRNIYMETYKSSMKNNQSLESVMCHLNFVYSTLGAIIQDIQYMVGAIYVNGNTYDRQNRMMDQDQQQKQERNRKYKAPNGKLKVPNQNDYNRQSEPSLRVNRNDANPMDLQGQNRRGPERPFQESVKKQSISINTYLNNNRKSEQVRKRTPSNQSKMQQKQLNQGNRNFTFGNNYNNSNGFSSTDKSNNTFGEFQNLQKNQKPKANNYLIQIKEEQQQESKPVRSIFVQQKRNNFNNISQDGSEMGPTIYDQSCEKERQRQRQRNKGQSQSLNQKSSFDNIFEGGNISNIDNVGNIGKANKGSFQQFFNQFGQRKPGPPRNNLTDNLKNNKITTEETENQQNYAQASLESQDDFMKHLFNKKKR